MVVYLAFRNLLLQRKRYMLMAAAVLIGFLLVTVLTALAQGAMVTVQAKAARYFAGHISVMGYRLGDKGIEDPDVVAATLADSGFPFRSISRRTIYHGKDPLLFFGGKSIRQRRLVGIEFESEREEFSSLAFSSGGADSMTGPEGENGVLISEVAAGLLGARLGDDITLYLTTDNGQFNTATLIVRGIFRETGIFGYVTYLRNEDLNRLIERPADASTDIAIFVREGADFTALAEIVRNTLAREHRVFPPVLRREDLGSVVDRSTQEETLAVVSLDAQLAEIKDLVEAFLMIANFVVVLFMLIVMFGILNTYRVLLHKRTREIGTMRALGMSRGGVKGVFLFEAAGLSILASSVGFLLAIVILYVAGRIDIGSGPAVAMFTEHGRLQFSVQARTVLGNLAVMVTAVLFAAWGPAYRASRLDPVQALRKET